MPEIEPLVLDSRGADSNLLQIVLSIFKGRRYLDVRRYFRTTEGTLAPTRKGIALGSNDFHFLVRAIHSNETKIVEWLERGDEESWIELKRVRAAVESARYEAKSFIRSARPERTLTFFSIAEEGGKLKLVYNQSHPLYNELEQVLRADPSDSRMVQLFDFVLVAYARCRAQFNPEVKVDPDVLFDSLEAEWGKSLKQYIEDRKS